MLIADITSVVCGMEIGLLGRKSQQRRSDFLLLGELLQNENYIRMAEGRGSATLYRIDFMRNLNLVVKIVGEGNSEVFDETIIKDLTRANQKYSKSRNVKQNQIKSQKSPGKYIRQ